MSCHSCRATMHRCHAATHGSSTSPRRAFTLVELLVVITIIGILAALVTAGAVRALNAAKRASIKTEIDQLDMAFERYKNDFGSYPPNLFFGGCVNPANVNAGDSRRQLLLADVKRHLKKAFPRHQEPDLVLHLLVGMSPAEATVFWLRGFSDNPKFPLTGTGGPVFNSATAIDPIQDSQKIHDFEVTRLGPRNLGTNLYSGRVVQANINGVPLQVNFWTYTPRNQRAPFAYVDTSRDTPIERSAAQGGPGYDLTTCLDPRMPTSPQISAIKTLRAGAANPASPLPTDIAYANQGKFQILHAGIDDTWGPFAETMDIVRNQNNLAAILRFPEGPFIAELADTQCNFSTNTFEDAQP